MAPLIPDWLNAFFAGYLVSGITFMVSLFALAFFYKISSRWFRR